MAYQWHNDQAERALAQDEVRRILGPRDGIDIDSIHRRTGSRAFLDTLPACAGPCQQGRRLCPCPEACERMNAEPMTSSDMKWVYCCIAVPIVLVAIGALIGWPQ